MITMASFGELPALPLGQSYPKKKGWLLGPVRKSKQLKFKQFKKAESMNFVVVSQVSQFFEAFEPKFRKARLDKVARIRKIYGRRAATAAKSVADAAFRLNVRQSTGYGIDHPSASQDILTAHRSFATWADSRGKRIKARNIMKKFRRVRPVDGRSE